MDRFIAMKSFVEVASQQSFTKAAAQLQLSRLQVSRHVQDVEAWLQQRLLHRTTRQVSLTPAGQEALDYCQRILSEVCALEFNAQAQSEQLSGCIRIAAPISFASTMLFDAVEKFTLLHTNINIDIIASDNIEALVEERIDIALRFTEQPDESLIARKLINLESVLCVAPSYIEQHGLPLHPDQLSNHNCFVHLNQSEWSFVENEQTFAVNVAGNIKANALNILIKAALNGRGIVRAPCDLANPLIQSEQLLPILTDYTRWRYSLWAVYLSRSYQSPKVRAFIDFLVEEFKQDIYLIPQEH